MVIETMTFRLAPGADEATFLAADRLVQADFGYRQPGLLRRTTARGQQGTWIVVDLWQSESDAIESEARWDVDPVAGRFMSLVDRDSVRTERYTTLD